LILINNNSNNNDDNDDIDEVIPIYEESVIATAVGRLGLKVLACMASFVYSCGNDYNDDDDK